MTEIDGLYGVVTSVTDAASFVIDIDTTGFTAFAWPVQADVVASSYQAPTVVPIGVDAGVARAAGTNDGSQAVRDTYSIGIELAGGAAGPAGANADIIYWIAGKSYSVSNS